MYVDICHRAALMYAFACLVLAEVASRSAWSETVNAAAASGPCFCRQRISADMTEGSVSSPSQSRPKAAAPRALPLRTRSRAA